MSLIIGSFLKKTLCEVQIKNVQKYHPSILSIRMKDFIHSSIRKYCYYRYKYSSEVEKLINRQIQAEQQIAQEYLSIAVAFLHPFQSRTGAGHFFMKMYEEELSHMQNLIQYQLLRGGTASIVGLNAPTPFTNITLLDAFKKGLELEKANTQLLENIVSVAEKENDHQCADYIISIYLAEQVHSINDMANHVTKLTRLNNNELAIYDYDLHLAKSPNSHQRQPDK